MTRQARCRAPAPFDPFASLSAIALEGRPPGPVLSVITAERPERISKAFRLVDGGLDKQPGGNMTRGKVEVHAIGGLDDLAAILASLTPAQALTYGIPPEGASCILDRRAFEEAGRPDGYTTRTKETFRWSDGAGVLMLDHDPGKDRHALDRVALVGTIYTAVPALADAAMLWLPSASSCIWQGERELRGISGQRLWMIAASAADIPRAGGVLRDRLWLAGHGWFEVSKSGALLERTLIDASVWQPSRLDFAGGAACSDGLQQRRGDPVRIDGVAEIIDTTTALPDLTATERAELSAIKAEARKVASSEAQHVRNGWIAERVQEMTAKAADDPEAFERAEHVAQGALDHGVLSGDYILHVEVAGRVEPVSIGTILDDRMRWHGLLCRDPVEPDYDGGRLVGRLYLMQSRPVVHSFAHGGASYRLHRAPATVEVEAGGTAHAVDMTNDLLRADPLSFDFAGQLATVSGGKVHPLDLDGLTYHLHGIAAYQKFDGRTEAFRPCDPPQPLVRQLLALGERRGLKRLEAVVTAPTIRLDGSVLDRPGYDARTGLLLDIPPAGLPPVIERPTLEQARKALSVLMEPFGSFPFVDAAAKGALLAALLTAVVRPVLPTAPAFGFDAPIQGSGKTLLATCIGALVEGSPPDVWPHTHGRDDEETRKRLFTALRAGSRALIWDNITGTFDSAAMAAFITAPAMVDRVLGKSEAIRVPNRALLILTGNNMSLAGDMPRRVIVCRIDPQTSEPFARQFDLDPLAHVLDRREEMVAAACTLIRARFTHQMKPAPGRLASFEAWDDLVRQTVVWCDVAVDPFGFGDPMDLIREAQAADPEGDALFALLDALRDKFGSGEFAAKDVHEAMTTAGFAASRADELSTALQDLAGGKAAGTTRGIGRVLKFREGRIVHGLRLTSRADNSRGVRIFRIRADENGFKGDNGFSSHPREKLSGDSFIREGETNPPNPPNPFW